MKFLFMLVAESAVVDRRTNNLSIFNIMEQLNVVALPIPIPKCTIVTLIERLENEGDSPLELKIIQGKNTLLHQAFTTNFQNKMRQRFVVELQGLAILELHTIDFVIFKDNRKVANYSVKVQVIEKPKVEEIS